MGLIFETERLIVRRYNYSDRDNFFSLSGDADVMRYIRPVSTREQSEKFLSEYIASYELNPLRGRWAVEEKSSRNFIGSFAIIPIPSMPEKIQLGYSLRPEHWGKGFATELTKQGLKYFFAKDILPVIYGVTEKPNEPSQKVLLKAGFEFHEYFTEENKELCLFVYKGKQSPY
jgi:ribosomal-protein-alanine N-acetyltransferase